MVLINIPWGILSFGGSGFTMGTGSGRTSESRFAPSGNSDRIGSSFVTVERRLGVTVVGRGGFFALLAVSRGDVLTSKGSRLSLGSRRDVVVLVVSVPARDDEVDTALLRIIGDLPGLTAAESTRAGSSEAGRWLVVSTLMLGAGADLSPGYAATTAGMLSGGAAAASFPTVFLAAV